ncbi:MAG: sugar phosphate isomerase/epimerase family protein [Armatimonadota bacterium]
MRLGGPVHGTFDGAEAWADAAVAAGWRAVYCPVDASADDATVAAYVRAAESHDLVIAEVGAWSNPLSPDPEVAKAAVALCRRQLELADRIGARCCVNIAGSRGAKWDGPSPLDLLPETFDQVVETVRGIIDAVRPRRTFWTLETMPWMFPHTVDTYLELIRAIDRDRFAVHLDPVNLIDSPAKCFASGDLARDCVRRLGPWVRSVHLKDIRLSESLTVHLDEVEPGQGTFDHAALLTGLHGLDPDLPVMLEHLPDAAAYARAADHVRGVARSLGIVM